MSYAFETDGFHIDHLDGRDDIVEKLDEKHEVGDVVELGNHVHRKLEFIGGLHNHGHEEHRPVDQVDVPDHFVKMGGLLLGISDDELDNVESSVVQRPIPLDI